jgi:hypothetical protein
MNKITINFPLVSTLNEGPLRIRQQFISTELQLVAGDQTHTTDPIEIGTFFQNKVFAQLSIHYSYDPTLNYVTIAGPQDSNARQIAIHTSLDQNQKTINKHVLNQTEAFVLTPNFWKNHIDNSSVLNEVFRLSLRNVLDTLVNTLIENGIDGVIQTGPAPIVTSSNYADYKSMFKPSKVSTQSPTLEDIMEVQEAVQSTYYGTITWNLNYSFANIIGSTHDPKPSGYSSWIALWADKCNNGYNTTHCSSFNYSDGSNSFVCNTSDFVGGHVIPGTVASAVAKGGTAYIFPICKRHNGNDNIYMSMRYNPVGVVLHNYNQ